MSLLLLWLSFSSISLSSFCSFFFFYLQYIPYLFSTISLFHLDPCMLHLFIFTVSTCVSMFVCMVHHCTWACYLLATLLGLAVGQNILRALTFPGSPTPPSVLSFPVCQPSKNMPVRSWAICMLPSCHPPPPLSSSLTPSLLYIHFSFFSSPPLILHLSVLYSLSMRSPCSSPLWPLAATVNPLHVLVSVHSAAQAKL